MANPHAKKIGRCRSHGKESPEYLASTPMIRFGPAGFLYKDWEGVVYPQPRPRKFDHLAYIASYFDTIEINSSFYGPPSPKTAASWAGRVAGNSSFRFTAKMWQRFTHQRKAAWTPAEADEVRAGFDVLMNDGKLGAVLLQFPWSFRRTEENREWLGDVVHAFGAYPLVLEVRHKSWLAPELFRALEEEGVGFVNIDQPLYRDSIGPSAHATSHVGYVRVHGRNYMDWFRKDASVEQRYNYLYKAEELEPWAERVTEVAEDAATKDVYVVTNNHYRGKAVANALMLKSMVTGETVAAPPAVMEEYGAELRGYAVKAESSAGASPYAGK
jgi:uncharacterized protein YecE (DUF72 family)